MIFNDLAQLLQQQASKSLSELMISHAYVTSSSANVDVSTIDELRQNITNEYRSCAELVYNYYIANSHNERALQNLYNEIYQAEGIFEVASRVQALICETPTTSAAGPAILIDTPELDANSQIETLVDFIYGTENELAQNAALAVTQKDAAVWNTKTKIGILTRILSLVNQPSEDAQQQLEGIYQLASRSRTTAEAPPPAYTPAPGTY